MQTDPTANTRIQLRLPRKLSSPPGNAGSKSFRPPPTHRMGMRERGKEGWMEGKSLSSQHCVLFCFTFINTVSPKLQQIANSSTDR